MPPDRRAYLSNVTTTPESVGSTPERGLSLDAPPMDAARRAPVERVAVVINGNARRVTEALVGQLERVVHPGDLFVSRSLEEAEPIARAIVQAGYRTVLTGGGDGTFVLMVTLIVRASQELGRHPPRFGMLKLGTGNALAWVLGNQAGKGRPGVVSDLKRIATEGGRSTLRLLDVEGSLTPFAGLGIDAICLEHYNETKRTLSLSPLTRPFATGPAAYMISTLGRSLPEFLLRSHPWVRIVNEGSPCVRLGPDDRPVSEHPQGAILYDGPSRLVAMSTIPYWGFGARIFPFADERDDRFALRVCDVTSVEVAANIGSIWRGKYRNERTVHDFLCENISIHYETPMALQVGGDVVGRRTLVRARLANPIEVVDYYAPPPVGAD
ncbi:MAG: diacylglycerol kinase family protein [Myxococcales bacterium]